MSLVKKLLRSPATPLTIAVAAAFYVQVHGVGAISGILGWAWFMLIAATPGLLLILAIVLISRIDKLSD